MAAPVAPASRRAARRPGGGRRATRRSSRCGVHGEPRSVERRNCLTATFAAATRMPRNGRMDRASSLVRDDITATDARHAARFRHITIFAHGMTDTGEQTFSAIRPATLDDLQALTEIYNYYVV